jgi:hypothetical protein
MAGLSSNSRLIVAPSGHAVHFEQPALVVRAFARSSMPHVQVSRCSRSYPATHRAKATRSSGSGSRS